MSPTNARPAVKLPDIDVRPYHVQRMSLLASHWQDVSVLQSSLGCFLLRIARVLAEHPGVEESEPSCTSRPPPCSPERQLRSSVSM